MMPPWVSAALAEARVGRLATADEAGAIRLVPICFAVVDGWVVSAVDHKPKRTGQLRRLDDITTAGSATFLVDRYDDDWTQLWWVRIRGTAEVVEAGAPAERVALEALAGKYPQYSAHPPRGPVYRVRLDELRWWRFTDPQPAPGSAEGATSPG